MADHLALLREVINRRAIIFAQTYHLPHFLSKGGTVFFEPYIDKSGNTRHGNFCDASYNMIYKNPTWAGCLKKTLVHRNSLPLYKQSVASELDSSSSSSALLMNIFCYPDIFSSARLFSMFGIDGLTAVFNKHVPLQKKDGFHESVNIDMIMGDNRYISAALTQSGFSERRKEDMYLYSSFDDIFDSDALPQTSASFLGSNVLRSIMAGWVSSAKNIGKFPLFFTSFFVR